ncbi:MAG: hypothetical protein INR64_00880 [Caulobacteraceae bacterium]|nr:hypothetical protein [Caulobacter sp.]
MSAAADEAAPGREALEGMDAVLARRPDKDDHRLTEVVKALCAWRDALIGRHRAAPLPPHERDRLERLNAVIGVTFGLQFPQAAPPWEEFKTARGWLAALLQEAEAA